MKKFSQITKTEVPETQDVKKGDDYLNYSDEVNVDILKHEKPRKAKRSKQTNIQDTKQMSDMSTKSVKAPRESKMEEEKVTESNGNGSRKVTKIGKVAKFPKGTKASKAYNFLENVKISKNKIWYMLIEKQEDELQMVKYSTKQGVNLTNFINELKEYYIEKYGTEENIKMLENINVAGDKQGNFSMVKNIPNIKVDDVKLIRKITEDLTVLLNGKCK